MTAKGNDVKPATQACYEAGSHDFTEPVVLRHGWHLLNASAEAVVSICRRCGAIVYGGWTETT